MGTIQHHAIVVTSYFEEVAIVHQKAVEIFEGALVTPVVAGQSNGYRSFMIAPDGSKEGWETSDRYEKLRDQFVAWLEESRGVPRSDLAKGPKDWSPCKTPIYPDWVEVSYGELGVHVTRSYQVGE